MAVLSPGGPTVSNLQPVLAGVAVFRGLVHEPGRPDGGVPSKVRVRGAEEIGRGEVLAVRDQLRRVGGVSDGGDVSGDGGEGCDREQRRRAYGGAEGRAPEQGWDGRSGFVLSGEARASTVPGESDHAQVQNGQVAPGFLPQRIHQSKGFFFFFVNTSE